jgi:hypothetical protein
MKKKCRLYKPTMQTGGEPRKPAMTQDSQKDPVFIEKSNNFLNWLHKSSDAAKVQTMMDQDMALLDAGYQIGGQTSENPMIEQLRSILQPKQVDPSASGFETGNYGQKQDFNIGAYQNAVQQRQPNFMNNMSQFTTGMQMQFAQEGGASFPGLMPLIPELDESNFATDKHNPYATSAEAFESFADVEQADPFEDYTTAPEPQMQEFVPGGPDDPFKKETSNVDPFGMDPRNANIAQGIIAGGKALTSIVDYRGRRKQEEALKRRMSDVFQTHGTAGPDRGDYLANVPGVGSDFKPDQHTRMGYNTKIAQSGGEYNMDDEVELSEAEINKLISQGYNLEYLD